MNNQRSVLLCFSSNIDQYNIQISDGCRCASVNVNCAQQCIRFYTNKRMVQIVATPMTAGFDGRISLNFDTCQKCKYCSYLQFPRETAPEEGTYTFVLTDATYGLPINGNLQFDSI